MRGLTTAAALSPTMAAAYDGGGGGGWRKGGTAPREAPATKSKSKAKKKKGNAAALPQGLRQLRRIRGRPGSPIHKPCNRCRSRTMQRAVPKHHKVGRHRSAVFRKDRA